MTSIIIALDPALNSPGLAISVDGVIRHAEAFSGTALADLPIGPRIDRLSKALARRAYAVSERMTSYGTVEQRTFVYEKPQIYGGPRPEDPNDQIHIAMVGAAWIAYFPNRSTGEPLLTPTPREWTGGAKKWKKNYWESPRGRHLAARLSDDERALVGDSHDAADAASLCLWACGRWAAKRVISRGKVK